MREMWLYCKYISVIRQVNEYKKAGEVVSITQEELAELLRKVVELQYAAMERAKEFGMRYNLFLNVFEEEEK